MNDYINRQAAIEEACKGCNIEFSDEPCEPSECKIRERLINIQAADVRENVKGTWSYDGFNVLINGLGAMRCSACNEIAEYPTNYCPNCGADMRTD